MEEKLSPERRHRYETVIDLIVIFALLALGVLTIVLSPSRLRITYGVMLLVLWFGIAFHLIARVLSFRLKDSPKVVKLLGLSKLVCSVTFTLGILLFLWLDYYFYLTDNAFFFMVGAVVASVRIIACSYPDNNWFSSVKPRTGVLRFRTIPMLILLILLLISVFIANFDQSLWESPSGYFYFPLLLVIIGYGGATMFGDKNPRFNVLMLLNALGILGFAILGLLL